MPQLKPQRRARSIACTNAERDAILDSARVCRVATSGVGGAPHVAPLWFVWDGKHLWLNSLVKSQRWADLIHNPRAAVVVDGGESYHELHGVEIEGEVEIVGEVPRGSGTVDELTSVELAYARKYSQSDNFSPDGRHAWLRIRPTKITSWDFRKIPSAAPSVGDSLLARHLNA